MHRHRQTPEPKSFYLPLPHLLSFFHFEDVICWRRTKADWLIVSNAWGEPLSVLVAPIAVLTPARENRRDWNHRLQPGRGYRSQRRLLIGSVVSALPILRPIQTRRLCAYVRERTEINCRQEYKCVSLKIFGPVNAGNFGTSCDFP